MIITIEVTQNNIIAGLAGSCGECPLAIALYQNDRLTRFMLIEVANIDLILFHEVVTDKSGFERVRILEYTPPDIVQNFIRNFDESDGDVNSVKPFQFDLNLDHLKVYRPAA